MKSNGRVSEFPCITHDPLVYREACIANGRVWQAAYLEEYGQLLGDLRGHELVELRNVRLDAAARAHKAVAEFRKREPFPILVIGSCDGKELEQNAEAGTLVLGGDSQEGEALPGPGSGGVCRTRRRRCR